MTQPRVEVKTLDDLQPDPNNVNKHSVRGHTLVENSLRKRGAFRSVAAAGKGVDKPVVMAGNLTIEKARDAGFQEVIFVHTNGRQLVSVIRDDLEPGSAEAIALGLEDNESAAKSYNPDIEILAALAAGDNAILSALRSEDKILNGMIEGMGLKAESVDAPADVDRAAELLEKWQVVTGDLWQIGTHRLICGDCTDAATVARVMQGERAECAITSPPYAEQRKDEYGGTPVDKYVDWWEAVQNSVKSILVENGSFFVNIKPHCEERERVLYVFDLVLSMKRKWGWMFYEEYIWKHQGAPGYGGMRLRNQFEPIYQFTLGKPKLRNDNVKQLVTEGGRRSIAQAKSGIKKSEGAANKVSANIADNWNGDYQMVLPGNVIEIGLGDGSFSHAAAFPERLPAFFIKAYSDDGDIWFEPFSGSGTTLVACENLGRRGRAVEISAAYCAVTLERMSQAFPHLDIHRENTDDG